MIVVSDTSSILALFQINHINLLQDLYGQVFIPERVMNELLKSRISSEQKTFISTSSFFISKPISNVTELFKLLADIDQGEAEAIILTEELKADLLLIDESIGRKIAKQRGINIIGVLGIIAEAKRKGLIKKAKPLFDSLISKVGFWISEDLYNFMLKSLNEQ